VKVKELFEEWDDRNWPSLEDRIATLKKTLNSKYMTNERRIKIEASIKKYEDLLKKKKEK